VVSDDSHRMAAVQAALSVDTSAWHPGLAQLYRYWVTLHDPSICAPLRRRFDPIAVPQLLSHLWMLDIQHEPEFRLRYRLLGTRVEQVLGRALKGQWLDECHPWAKHPTYFVRYREVMDTGIPSWRKGPPMFWHDKVGVIENVILPLSESGERVDYFLIETRFYRPDGVEM